MKYVNSIVVWVVVAGCVCYALSISQDPIVLWALMIPLFITIID